MGHRGVGYIALSWTAYAVCAASCGTDQNTAPGVGAGAPIAGVVASNVPSIRVPSACDTSTSAPFGGW
jgi:hypothetical protein